MGMFWAIFVEQLNWKHVELLNLNLAVCLGYFFTIWYIFVAGLLGFGVMYIVNLLCQWHN